MYDGRRDWPVGLLDAWVVLFSIWTIHCNLCVAFGAPFRVLLYTSPVPIAVAVSLWIYVKRPVERATVTQTASQEEERRHAPGWYLAGAAVIAVFYAATESALVLWIASAAWLLLGAWRRAAFPTDPGSAENRREGAGLLGLCLLAVAITLVAHRPDADDAFYLSVPVFLLDHADTPLLSADTMHGEPGWPFLENIYRVHSYELAVAVLAAASHVSPATIYYLLLPVLSAILVVVAHFLAIREISGTRVVMATGIVLLVLVAWGSRHQTYGNFAFVRLFQGKAVLVSLWVPATVFSCVRFLRLRDGRSWVLLALTQIAAVGASSSALLVMPFLLLTCLLAGWLLEVGRRTVAAGFFSSAYLWLLIVWLARAQASTSPPLRFSAERVDALVSSFMMVLGGPLQASSALFALLLLPGISGSARTTRYRLALAAAFFLLCPFIAILVSRLGEPLRWRLLWAVPFPLIFGLLASGLLDRSIRWNRYPAGPLVLAVLLAPMVIVPDFWTLSRQNSTRLVMPGYKVNDDYAVAAAVVDAAPAGRSILAPWGIDQWLPLFSGHPPLVAVRPNYMHIVAEAEGETEALERKMLVDFVGGDAVSLGMDVGRAKQMIERRRLGTVVLPMHLAYREELGAALLDLGYRKGSFRNYEIWVKGPAETSLDSRQDGSTTSSDRRLPPTR